MTCIVGVEINNKTYMGSDSSAVTDTNKWAVDEPKLFIRDGLLFGYAGCFRMANLIQYQLKVPKHRKSMTDKEYLNVPLIEELRRVFRANDYTYDQTSNESSLLIGYRGKLYTLENGYILTRTMGKYAAIGTGAAVALGSLYATKELGGLKPEQRLQLALRAAVEHSRGICAPYHYMDL